MTRMRLLQALGRDVADEDVVDEIGGGGEEIVVGGGDDLGEDGSHEQRAEELERSRAGEAVEAGVGEDLAGVVVDFAGGKEGGAGDGEGDDDGLEDDGADDPADDGAGGVLLGFGGEELLVHGLVAEHEQAGGEEELQAWMKVRSPKTWKWVAGRAAWTADQPPALWTRTGSAMQRVKVASRPMATSM